MDLTRNKNADTNRAVEALSVCTLDFDWGTSGIADRSMPVFQTKGLKRDVRILRDSENDNAAAKAAGGRPPGGLASASLAEDGA